MDNNSTNIFDAKDINNTLVSDTLNEAVESLEERGYNSINQLVGYVMMEHVPTNRNLAMKIISTNP